MDGFRRHDGAVGVRNHLLVLPSVVCSSHAAASIAEGGPAIAITHQHGCLHVGDDLGHTEAELIGAAASPNVAAAVVVSLGCETLNGRRLADRIRASGQRTELIGIQREGGTRRAIDTGRRAVSEISAETVAQARTEISPGELTVGIDELNDPLAEPIAAALRARGLNVLPAPGGLRGAEAHVALTRARAQLIVSLPSEDEGPIGFAVSPVIAVARGAELHRALSDDFDVARRSGEDALALAERVAERVLAHAGGEPTASERRGAHDFVLRRLAVTM